MDSFRRINQLQYAFSESLDIRMKKYAAMEVAGAEIGTKNTRVLEKVI